ncbi:MAG: ATP-binding protein [bacterium]
MSDAPAPTHQSKRLDMRELACTRLFNEVPCYISVQDRDFRIVEANSKVTEEFGDRISEFCYSVFKGRAERCPECPVARTFEDGREHTSEEKVFDRRGLPHDMLVNTKPLLDHTGRIVAVMELFTDITVNKELQNRLHDSLMRFHTMFDRVPCYISVQDQDFRILEANSLFKENFGDRLGGYCYEIYKKRGDRCPVCPVAQTFEDGMVHSSEEVVIGNDGSEVNVLVYTSPIMDPRGNIVSVIEMSADITEVRRLQDRLTTLGQLVGGIAHSIKNVLEGLRGGVYVANLGFKNKNEEDIRTGWEMVQRNLDKISAMIMDMLYCAKERTPRRLPVSITSVAEESIELFRTRAGESNVSLKSDLAENIDTILADPKDIHSLLSNLITNAIDACCSDENEEKEHRVDLRVFQEDKQVVIEVKDNGIGMDRDTKSKLFNTLYSTKGTFGTGLGLLVSHKVATEHGGTISVESAPGEGAVFTVRLPVGAG